MRIGSMIPAAVLLAGVHAVVAAPLRGQRIYRGDDDLAMEAPPTARSAPTWLIRSPDLRSARVTIALGVPRDDTVAVHVTEGDVVLDGEFSAAVASAWADSAIALLRETSEREPPGGASRTPIAIGREGITLQLEVMGSGERRRFGLVVADSLALNIIAPELDVAAAHLLVTQLRALGDYATGARNAEKILYALRPPYFEFQVEKPAIALQGNPAPRYPETMLSQGLGGEVLVQFVVDTSGRANMRTFKVLKATHPDFAWAVRIILGSYRFRPAETDGRKVAMYVQMPFKFDIGNRRMQMPMPYPGWPRREGWP